MQSFLGVLLINDTLIYFVYGQVFFSLGLAIALHSRRHSQLDLARQLTWLAAFGLSHGLYEWAHIFIPIQATYLPATTIALLNAARIALLAVSFFFLGQFGALVAVSNPRIRLAVRLAFAAQLAAWLAWTMMLAAGGDAPMFVFAHTWIRRVMAFPAGVLAAFGMLRQARSVADVGFHGIARDFRMAAVSFGVYAFLAGLIVPRQDPLVAQWPTYRIAIEFLGLPAPVLRSLAGLGIVYGIVRGLRIFEFETDRRLEEAERARLDASERSRSAMEAMATTISERHDLAQLLHVALGQIVALSGSAAGWLMLAERGTGWLRLGASRGLQPVPASGAACTPKDHCACDVSLRTGKAATYLAGYRCHLWGAGVLLDRGASIPLVAHGRQVGIVHLAGGDVNPEMMALLTSVGKQLALAVENAELAREVARKEAARAQLLRKVITAQEEERRRVARELHDQTGQSLTAVIMALGAAQERMARGAGRVSSMVDEAREVAVRALESTREMIMGLRPSVLDDLGLVPALRRLAEDLARKGGLEISIEANGLGRRLPGDVEIVMFRIIQESLHNVLRHSGARRASVQIACTDTEVRAEVADDGRGFDLIEATSRPESGRGLGVLGMSERAGLLGGEVLVETAPGRGTRVLVRIPLLESVKQG